MNPITVSLAKLPLKPEELDKQSVIKITEWLDVNSEECRDKDPDFDFTRKILNMKFLMVDSLGRIWGYGKGGDFFPFHFEYGKKVYGYRLSSVAAN